MPSIQIEATLTPSKLLEAIEQLSLPELEALLNKAALLRAQRIAPVLSHSESKLLQKINEGLPSKIMEPFRELRDKMESGTLTEAEHAEYMGLVETIEKYNVERLTWLIELAQLRNQSVAELMESLGLNSKNA
jgi:hypothetical protein